MTEFDILDLDSVIRIGNIVDLKRIFVRNRQLVAGEGFGMELACEYGQLEIAKFLYKKGVEITESAFRCAFRNRHIPILMFLYNVRLCDNGSPTNNQAG